MRRYGKHKILSNNRIRVNYRKHNKYSIEHDSIYKGESTQLCTHCGIRCEFPRRDIIGKKIKKQDIIDEILDDYF